MLDEFLGEEDEWGIADRRVKPALLTLLHDQAELLKGTQMDREASWDLRTGFPSRRALIEWYQRAAVRTIGEIDEDWDPVDCITDDTLLAATIVTGGNPSGMGPEKAKKYRRLLESGVVQPACNRAYKKLRSAATEYIKTPDEDGARRTSDGDLDPRRQKHVAMRPGYQSIDVQQQRALGALWGGFGTEEALLDWAHGLNSPSNGEIGGEFAEGIVYDDVAMGHLVYDRETPVARSYREVIAAAVILPAFVDGVTSMDSGELAKSGTEAPTTLRMRGGVDHE